MYVYRFKDRDEQIVYVGKTNNLSKRIKTHFSNAGHLEEYQYAEVATVECIVFSSRIDMDIKELYYINKWKPKFNTRHVSDEDSNIKVIEDGMWELYYTKDEGTKKGVGESLDTAFLLKEEIEQLKKKVDNRDTTIGSLNFDLLKHLEGAQKMREEIHLLSKDNEDLKFALSSRKENDFNSRNANFLHQGMSNLHFAVPLKDALNLLSFNEGYKFSASFEGVENKIIEISREGFSFVFTTIYADRTKTRKVIGSGFQEYLALTAIEYSNNLVVSSSHSIKQFNKDMKKARRRVEKVKKINNRLHKYIFSLEFDTSSEIMKETEEYLGYPIVAEENYGMIYDYSSIWSMIDRRIYHLSSDEILMRLRELNGKGKVKIATT